MRAGLVLYRYDGELPSGLAANVARHREHVVESTRLDMTRVASDDCNDSS